MIKRSGLCLSPVLTVLICFTAAAQTVEMKNAESAFLARKCEGTWRQVQHALGMEAHDVEVEDEDRETMAKVQAVLRRGKLGPLSHGQVQAMLGETSCKFTSLDETTSGGVLHIGRLITCILKRSSQSSLRHFAEFVFDHADRLRCALSNDLALNPSGKDNLLD
jgi:hypothetical protein